MLWWFRGRPPADKWLCFSHQYQNTTSASYCYITQRLQQVTASLFTLCVFASVKRTYFCVIVKESWALCTYSKQWMTVHVWSIHLPAPTHRPSQQSSPLHTSLAVAVRPGLIQPISSKRDSGGGTCCVSSCPVSKCQQPRSMSAIQ